MASPGARRPLRVVVLLAALLIFYLHQAGTIRTLTFAAAERAGLAAAAPANPRLQVFFTTPTLIYPDHPWQRPAVPLLQQLIADIDRARSSVDIAVFDFDLATRDPDRPTRLRPEFDSGDHIHPNDAGNRAMAEAVDLKLFR